MHPTDAAYLTRKLTDARSIVSAAVADLETTIAAQTADMLAGGHVPGKLHVYIRELAAWRDLANRIPEKVNDREPLQRAMITVAAYMQLVDDVPARRSAGEFGAEVGCFYNAAESVQ
jgi:hypothetical protein